VLQQKLAELAGQIQRTIGCPITKQFIKVVNNRGLPGCLISTRDIINAEDIYRPVLGILIGKQQEE
jgi:hypothetical protein